jgi:hypothetical protein
MQARRVTKSRWLEGLAAWVLLVGCTMPTSSGVPGSATQRSGPSSFSATSSGTSPTTISSRTTATPSVPPHVSRTTSTPIGSPGTGSAGTALATLGSLPVRGRAPKTGYSRSRFGQAWTDDVTADGGHNGCDTRNDVLRRDLSAVVIKAGTQGCVAASGVLRDPYTGRDIHFLRGQKTSDLVQIDHVVALSDAWQTGAQSLDAIERRNLGNDPLELLAVDGSANESKGDGDAASWLPPNKAYRCAYVARQIAVKARYGLWVTAPELAAMSAVLNTCPEQALPTTAGTDVPPVVRT